MFFLYWLQCCVVVGGMSIQKQARLLRRCPEIIIATPGRLWQLIQQVSQQLTRSCHYHMLQLTAASSAVGGP